MLDKLLTDGTKFFIMLIIYVVYLTWWASGLNTTVEQQLIISNKTIELLDAHLKDCKNDAINEAIHDAKIDSEIDHLRIDLDELRKKIKDGSEKG